MSARRVFLECGAAETRAALVIGDEVVRLALAPARGDEGLARPLEHGDAVVGRVQSIQKSLNGAFVDLGPDGIGFLPLAAKGSQLVEGERRLMAVRRPAIGAKSPVLTLDLKSLAEPSSTAAVDAARALGRVGPTRDAALIALARIGAEAGDQRHVSGAGAASLAGASGRDGDVGDRMESEEIFSAIDDALLREVALSNGARLVIDEVEGLTVVDVDAGAAADGATGRLADKVNAEAAKRLFVELARRRIGGRVVVDFLPPSDKTARAKLSAALKARASALYPCRPGRLAADGLFDLTAPRIAATLLEELTEPAGDDFIRPGRRRTRDAAAKAAVGALERRLASARAARPRLFVGAELADYLDRDRPQWRARLEATCGSRFAIERAPQLKDRDHELVG